MSLVKCPECKQKISDSAEACPKCGYKIIEIKNKKSSTNQIKIIWSIVGIIFLFILFVYIFSDNSKISTVVIKVQSQRVMTPQQKIKSIISSQLDGADIRKVQLTKLKDNSLDLTIKYNAGENLTVGMFKGLIKHTMEDLYKKLFTSNLNLHVVDIVAYCPTVDQYGNNSYGIAYATRLSRAVAKKINWSSDYLETNVLPNQWEVVVPWIKFA